MKPFRRLILPAIVAAPAVMAATGLALLGPAGFPHVTLAPDALAIWIALTLAGLIVIGWPAAAIVARLPVTRAVRIPLLLAAGLAGGSLLAMVVGGDARAAWIGLAPGGIAAAIWILLNIDALADRPERTA